MSSTSDDKGEAPAPEYPCSCWRAGLIILLTSSETRFFFPPQKETKFIKQGHIFLYHFTAFLLELSLWSLPGSERSFMGAELIKKQINKQHLRRKKNAHLSLWV